MLNLTKVSNSCYLMTQIYGSTLSICRRNIFANFVNGCIWEKEINCKCLINYLKTLGFQNGIIHRKIFDLTIFLLLTQPFQRLCIQVCKKKKKAFDLIAGTGQMQIDINLNEPPFISISYTHTHTHTHTRKKQETTFYLEASKRFSRHCYISNYCSTSQDITNF